MVSGRRVAIGPYHHAYHFDKALAGKWLRSKAKSIATIDDQVQQMCEDIDFIFELLTADVGEGELAKATVDAAAFPTFA